MIRGLKALLLGVLLLLCQYAQAGCTNSNSTIVLPDSSSFVVYNGTINTHGSAGFTCSGLGLSLLSRNHVSVKIASTSNNMAVTHIDGSGDKIAYMIYPDADYQFPYGAGQTIDYSDLNLLSLIFVSSSADFRLYIKTIAGANVRAGTYTDTINLLWSYRICGLGLLGLCVWWEGVDQPSTVSVSAIITKDCLIGSVPNVNFGSMALVGQFNVVNQSIMLTCTKTEDYNTYFTDGDNPTTGWRRMKSGISDFLEYQIYLPNTMTIWDITHKRSGSGTGLVQSIAYRAVINATQDEVPVGSYQDNLSFVLEY